MKKTHLIICLLFAVISKDVNSQVTLDNSLAHHRYWYYKERLKSYMIISQHDAPGRNIPASWRGGYDNYGNRILKWGDATIDLAYYIATLATEWELLHANGQSTFYTEEQLHGAVQALNRLDFFAETQFYNSGNAALGVGAPSLDGFLVRDDVPASFITDYPILNSGIGSSTIVTAVGSDMIDGIGAIHSPRAAGADQLINLLIAFRLVKKFVPSYVTFGTKTFAPYNPSETSILKEVQNISDRIFNRLSADNWLLYNSILGTHVPANDGGNLLGYPYPAAIAAICNQTNPSVGHADAITLATSPAWINMGSGGGTWTSPDCYAISNDNYLVLMLDAGTNTFVGGFACAKAQTDAYEIIPLIKQVLFGTLNCIPLDNYKILLRDAPCGGPYNWTNGIPPIPGLTYEADEWSSTHRWVHPERRYSRQTTHCGDGNEQPAEYNGLDYMLLHNLYYIADGGYNAQNLQILTDYNKTYPWGASSAGSIANPFISEAYSTLYISGLNVLAGTDVTYHAGYYLRMQPPNDCAIKPNSAGSVFHAYVAPFGCSSTFSYYHMMAPDTLTAVHPLIASMFEEELNDGSIETSDNYVQSYEQYLNSKTEEFVPEEKLASINIFPNPNSGSFQASIIPYTNIKLREVSIYTIMGNSIFNERYNNLKASYQFDISKYSKGLYFLKISDSNGRVQTEKIILN